MDLPLSKTTMREEDIQGGRSMVKCSQKCITFSTLNLQTSLAGATQRQSGPAVGGSKKVIMFNVMDFTYFIKDLETMFSKK